jgi:hypothetical protein
LFVPFVERIVRIMDSPAAQAWLLAVLTTAQQGFVMSRNRGVI